MAERAHPEDPGFKDRWFGLIRSRYKERLYERYRFSIPYIKNRRVLDVPCGVGWGMEILRGKASSLWGVDISQEALKYGAAHFSWGKVKYARAHMRCLPFRESSFDAVLCFEGFEHIAASDGHLFLGEAQRILVNGGLFLMTCPVLNESGHSTANPFHIYEYPESELVDLINVYFRILLLERIQGPDGPEYRMVLKKRESGTDEWTGIQKIRAIKFIQEICAILLDRQRKVLSRDEMQHGLIEIFKSQCGDYYLIREAYALSTAMQTRSKNADACFILKCIIETYASKDLSNLERDLLGKCYYKMATECDLSERIYYLDKALRYCPNHKRARELREKIEGSQEMEKE
jgi:ubiquinone/menaquinone biosynthesis C-methylase UbiE